MNNSLNLTKVPKEVRLLLELLKDDKNKIVNEPNESLWNDIDWALVLEYAMHHRIYPLLHSKVKAYNDELVPGYVRDYLNQKYRKNTFQMLHLSAEMESVNKLFSNHNIRTLFLKGPILAQELYGDISLRTCSDLDFIIPIECLDNAEKLLIGLGYEKDDYFKTVLNDWMWRHHHVTFFHPHKKIKLEVHWRLNPGPGLEPSFEELWEQRTKSTLTSSPVYLLGKEDLFLFLVSHGARHGWSRLRWLVDIQQLMKQSIDWVDLIKRLKKYHYDHIGGQAILLSSHLLSTPIKKAMTSLVKQNQSKKLAQEAIFYLERMVNLHTEPIPEDVSLYHKRHLFSLMSVQQKLFFIISFLYPYPDDLEVLPLPKHLHFLYFPLRPFLWAWRKTRKHVSIGGFNK